MFPVPLTIARVTFLETVRQPIYLIVILLAGLGQMLNVALSGYALSYSETSEVDGDNKMLLDIGLATVLFCGTLLAGFIATAAVSREIENKTVLTVVSKPVSRFAVIMGKYVGGSVAMLAATLVMILFLLVAIRHGVMSTVRDEIDMPVMVFSLGAVGLAFAIAIWGNFFYGWHFCQTATLLMVPLMFLGWVMVMLISKQWEWQPPVKDLKPQIMAGCAVIVMGMLVLTAIAVAASTRLSQVMTIVAVYGAFVLGLLSDHLIGRHAHHNDLVGEITIATPERERFQSFAGSGDTYIVTLKAPPGRLIRAGEPFYYGPNPNGFDLVPAPFTPYTGTLTDTDNFFKPETPPAIVITEAQLQRFTIRNIGNRPVDVWRPPQEGDFVFVTPTRTNWLAAGVWGMIPNMQFFWLTDAISQNRPAPPSHLFKVFAYSGFQVVVYLALAVVLFQKREVA